jgi:hypothetical protein
LLRDVWQTRRALRNQGFARSLTMVAMEDKVSFTCTSMLSAVGRWLGRRDDEERSNEPFFPSLLIEHPRLCLQYRMSDSFNPATFLIV